jgi:Flp pilus assembly protein TadG
MRLVPHSSAFKRATSVARSFRDATDGVAAIEFGFIVPIMLMLFLGCVELSQGVAASRRVSQVAGTAGDLTAQAPSATNPNITYVQNIMDVSSYLMAPYATSPLKVTVRSIKSGATATATNEAWKCVYDGANPAITCTCPATPATPNPYVLPTGLLSANDGVVVSEVQYAYTPLVSLNFFVKNPSTITLTEKLYLKPRNQLYIKLQKTATQLCD